MDIQAQNKLLMDIQVQFTLCWAWKNTALRVCHDGQTEVKPLSCKTLRVILSAVHCTARKACTNVQTSQPQQHQKHHKQLVI